MQVTSIALATAITFSSFIGVTEAKSPQYTVKSGDTLYSISKKNHLSVSQLKQWNKMKSNIIKPGQHLYIVNPNAIFPTKKKVVKPEKANTVKSSNVYSVKKGDTLYSLAKKHHSTVQALKSLNKLKSNVIKIGQSIKLPTKSSEKPTITKPKTPQKTDNKVPNQVTEKHIATIHTVKSGEYLFTIAQKYHTLVDEIKALNGLTSDMIYVGQLLKVTAGSVKAPTKPAILISGKFPLASGTYSPFGDTWNASRTYGGERPHEGIDIMSPIGTPIYAATDGKIVRLGWLELGGYRIGIQTAEGINLYYAHLSKYAVGMTLNKKVKKGQVIGYVGNTGYGPEGTTGKFDSHLHIGFYDMHWKAFNGYDILRYWEYKSQN